MSADAAAKSQPYDRADDTLNGANPRFLLLENIHSSAAEELRAANHDVRICSDALSEDELADGLQGYHVVGIRSKSRITASVLDANPQLLAIGCFCIGTNQVDLEAARQRGVAVFNSPFSNTRSVAELTVAEIIALHRRLGDRNSAMHRGEWTKSAANAHDVRGRVLGIVGYGHIGSQVSVLAEALGMRIRFYDIAHKLPIGNAESVSSLEELLAASDVVTVHVPETDVTRGMFNRERIETMKRGALFVNNARGSVFDEAALAAALRSGQLGGAALDVFPSEPSSNRASFESPLRGLPNVILTPHIGGSTEEAQEGIAYDVSRKLLRFLATGSTTSAVNVPEVDLPQVRPSQRRVLHFHRNVPGVLSKMHSILAELDININAEYLQSREDISYVILDFDATAGSPIRDALGRIDETIRLRAIW